MKTDIIPQLLLNWFDQNARILPWREDATPYRVWVSEIMLQQTRVEAVKPYFQRFLLTFPDITSLSKAEDDLLLKMWEGLGYYNRARNLRAAARVVMAEFGGELPGEKEQLMKLPGIGDYTSGSVASIAFGKWCTAIDGNVLRVIARLCANEKNILDKKVRLEVEQFILTILPRERPGDFNQALMELGALICIPNGAPKCEACPLTTLCLARMEDKLDRIPYKEKKKARKVEEKTVMIIQSENRLLLRKRPERGLLAGMYEFPSMDGKVESDQILAFVKEMGLSPIQISKLEDSRHIFTHREWQMSAYFIRVDDAQFSKEEMIPDTCLLIEKKEMQSDYPIPSAFKTYTKYLKMKLGNDAFFDKE